MRRGSWYTACVQVGLVLALTAAVAVAADPPTSAKPPNPAPANDSEREAFCKDAAARHIPAAIADAAALVLGHGFHFDSYQAVPARPSASSSAGATSAPVGTASPGDSAVATQTLAALAKIFRIQVMDDQNQALEIRVPSSAAGEPVAGATWEWMCWTPSTAATARADLPADHPHP